MKVPEPRKLPSGNYSIQMRLGGKSITITKSTARACKNEAMLVKSQYLAGKRDIDDGTYPKLKDAVAAYISARTHTLSPCTIRGYRVIEKNYFKSVMNTRIDAIDWQNEVNEMAQNYKPKTVKNAYRFIASVLEENGIQPKKIALPQLSAEERPYLSTEQILKFLEVLEKEPAERKIPIMMGLCGLRRSEIIAVDWKDVDLTRETIYVHRAIVPDENGNYVEKMTKTASSTREVPIIIPGLVAALKAVEDKSGKVCTMHPNSIYKSVNSLCAANGLPEVGVHGLRHSFASLGVSLQLPIQSMETFGGWQKNSQVLREVYQHAEDKIQKESRDKLSGFFGGVQ